ncbi:hypothetical protein CERZMDRAFT_122340 [Cercospora zeae-maydis SCOH1-5]|uniref:Apple domain-containing protein n=1 Tax=Cercospora zeae-maydis SCOH1-5 TaxID=717836 RepID=A0A6A6F4H4_9PEZI|nr:hypothetical protein CERZMDRAFT_122340 [Cercospora zeae-maydis SCOH1-5]
MYTRPSSRKHMHSGVRYRPTWRRIRKEEGRSPNFDECLQLCSRDRKCSNANYQGNDTSCSLKRSRNPAPSDKDIDGVVCRSDSMITSTTATKTADCSAIGPGKSSCEHRRTSDLGHQCLLVQPRLWQELRFNQRVWGWLLLLVWMRSSLWPDVRSIPTCLPFSRLRSIRGRRKRWVFHIHFVLVRWYRLRGWSDAGIG